jgi:hypothetical protein
MHGHLLISNVIDVNYRQCLGSVCSSHGIAGEVVHMIANVLVLNALSI